MATKNLLTIRLTESVVFLRTADRTSRHHVIPMDSSPSMVRGLLTLYLAKPTRISSIDLELQAKAHSAWSEGVGQRRVDVFEEEKIFSASTVFFDAASIQLSRRTTSVGPGVLRREEALGDWDFDHPSNRPNAHSSPPRRIRRVSADNSIFQRDYVTHRQDIHPTPPYTAPTPQPSPNFEVDSAQILDEIRDTSRTDLESINESLLPPLSSRPTSLPPTLSRNTPSISRYISVDDRLDRESTPSTPSQSTSRSPLPSHSRDNIPRVSTSPPPADKSLGEPRGRRAARFSFAGISNAIFGAVKGDRGRSGSPRPSQPEPLSPVNDVSRGRPVKKKAVGPTFGKFGLGELLKLDGDETSGDGWKEFRKGTYTYPISFTIPANSPPTLQCEYGSLTWRLKANVHRPGTFTQKLTAVRDVTVISCPGEDDMDEHENMIVERQWEGQMQYVITIPGKMFYVGGTIPIQLTFMPLAKVKIHRITAVLEERVEYHIQSKRIGRTDPVRRLELLSLKAIKKEGAILPLDSDDVEAFANSPFCAVSNPDSDPSEMASTLMGPGPWTFQYEAKLPSCTFLRFTNKNKSSNIGVGHSLKFVFRVERGDDKEFDYKTGKRKLFDIIVQTPVQIISCHCNPEWMSLPGYSESFEEASTRTQSCPCTARQLPNQSNRNEPSSASLVPPKPVHSSPPMHTHTPSQSHVPFPSASRSSHAPLDRIGSRGSATAGETYELGIEEPATSSTSGHRSHNHMLTVPELDTLFHRNELFERLVSGQESEIGEAPPAYRS